MTDRVSDPDYATWLTKQQAADAIGVTTKSIERLAQDRQLQQTVQQRDGRGPKLALYHPADVARIAAERRPGPPTGFLVPAEDPSATGNGHHGSEALARLPAAGVPSVIAGDDLLRAVVTALATAVSQTSQTPTVYVTLPEASAITGLTQAFLRRRIDDGALSAIRDRGWRIRRKDLEAL